MIDGFIVGGMLLLAFLNFTNVVGVNRKANLWFGFFLLSWSTFWLDGIIRQKWPFLFNEIYIFIRIAQLFVIPTFLISVCFYTDPKFGRNRTIKILSIFILINIFLLVFEHVSTSQKWQTIALVLFLTQSIAITIISYFRVLKHQRVIQHFSSDTTRINLSWIKYIIYCCILSAVLIAVYNMIWQYKDLNNIVNAFFVLVLFMIAYYSLRQKEIFPKGLNLDQTVEIEQLRTKLLSDEKLQLEKEKLINYMITKEPYLDSELNLVKLAKMLDLTAHQLSYIINNGFQVNFYQFVNRYRVEKAKSLLESKKMVNYNLVSVGFESGFNSKTTFNTVFKNITGDTPSEFKKRRSRL